MIREILRAILSDTSTVQVTNANIAREERTKLPDLTLEKAYTSLTADLAVMRADMHELAKEMREYERRAEQVHTWLGRLRTDLYEAMSAEAKRAFRKQDEKREAFSSENGQHNSFQIEPAASPRSPLDTL